MTTLGRLPALVSNGQITPDNTYICFDEVYKTTVDLADAWLTCEGFPKIIMSANPLIEQICNEIGAPCFGRGDLPIPNLRITAEPRGDFRRFLHKLADFAVTEYSGDIV